MRREAAMRVQRAVGVAVRSKFGVGVGLTVETYGGHRIRKVT